MSKTVFKQGNWAMIPPHKGKQKMWGKDVELGNSKKYQLYNLAEDPQQQNNLASSQPKKLQELITAYEAIVTDEYKPDSAYLEQENP
jgi:arylsulfatase A-like enzyme